MSQTKPRSKNSKRRLSGKRRGASAVEFAMTAPLLFMLIFAGMEFGRANTIRNLCDNAALEAARVGILPGATAQKCVDSATGSLHVLRIVNATVTVVPSTITPATPEVTVTVLVPMADNAMPMSRFVGGVNLSRSITLKRELN